MSPAQKTVYSTPGKALLAGGYLVLFPEYTALSIGLACRMHTEAEASANDSLTVSSPQFDSQWSFPSGEGPHKNPFIQACYDVVSAYFGIQPQGSITVWSDDGFHSQKDSTQGPNNFRYHHKPITMVPKTGLGSSAALVSAVVPAMCALVVAKQQLQPLELHQIHNLAQIAHAKAQNKVGSGFDVATAVYGSLKYSRFPATVIPSVLETAALKPVVDQVWQMQVERCRLPETVLVVMGDVSKGSETPGMVKKMLAWRESQREQADKVFNELNNANKALADALSTSNEPGVISDALRSVRSKLQLLTRESGVPVEPPRQTKLLDEATAVRGVLGGVVPGAGGDDAVCLLVDERLEPLKTVLSNLNKIEGVVWWPVATDHEGLTTKNISI